jgi:S1-C subfamily serine protease
MSLVDLLIVVLVIGAAIRGAQTGVVTQIGMYVGMFGGLLLGAWIAIRVAGWVTGEAEKLALTLLTLGVFAALFSVLGGWLGVRAAQLLRRIHLGTADTALGGIASVLGVLVVVWLLAGTLATLPNADTGRLIQDSAIIRRLDAVLPPAPEITARLGRLLDPLGFPQVFADLEPVPTNPVTGPTSAEVQAAADKAGRSTVKITGQGCGGLVEGSGFVAERDLVVTNAHVVAGIASPVVRDANGTHEATPLVFDPANDIAVLRAGDLAGPPLALADTSAPRGTVGAVLGYPNDGPLTVTPGAVLAEYSARGRDIYGENLVTRQIYALQASIRPGNSGGPFSLPDGTVAGVVFARSVTDPNVGYALTAAEIRPDLDRSRTQSEAVSTGSCVAD